jgi:adenosylcobinamide-GDP ribazoletransferase
VNAQWRLLLAALRFVARRRAPGDGLASGTAPPEASRFIPVAGILVGLLGAAVYRLAAELWPTSVAVVLSLLATVLATENAGANPSLEDHASTTPLEVRHGGTGRLYDVFVLLIKYNVLMALSAASVPFSLPEYFTLGLIMVAGQAASRALVVSVMANDLPAELRATAADLTIALIIGLAPASLLGIPGLIGLAAAIVMRLALTAYILPVLKSGFRERLDVTQQLTEVSFYLGALATWKYIS